MLNVKGFISIDTLVNNAVGTVGQLGELSTFGATFTTQIADYSAPTIADIHFIALYAVNTDTGATFQLEDAKSLHILTVARWIYDYNKTHTSNYTKLDLANDLMIAFPQISNVSVGNIVSDASNWLPEFIGWDNQTLGNYSIKAWFSDDALRQQYDEYKILTAPPISPLNKFFGAASTVVAAINAVTPAMQMTAIETLKARNPETVIRAYTFNYVAPVTHVETPTTWYAIIYGPAGDNDDTIKQAFIDYALANSSHTQAEWVAIMPDLFLSTEFTMVPLWELVAIPVMNLQAGMYSPVINPNVINAKATAAIPNYPPSQITGFVRVMPTVFKSVQVMAVGGPQNRSNRYLITDYFPDYIDVGTQSTDFGRQSTDTQNFSLLLEELLIVAESMTEFSTLPAGKRRIIRNGKLYVAANLKNVLYLVAAKSNGV